MTPEFSTPPFLGSPGPPLPGQLRRWMRSARTSCKFYRSCDSPLIALFVVRYWCELLQFVSVYWCHLMSSVSVHLSTPSSISVSLSHVQNIPTLPTSCRGVWKGGAKGTCPHPTGNSNAGEIFSFFWLTHCCNCYQHYISSASVDFAPDLTGVLPVDPTWPLFCPHPKQIPGYSPD